MNEIDPLERLLKKMAPSVDDSGVWERIEHRSSTRRRDAWAASARGLRGLRLATAALATVVLVGGAGFGIFKAVTYLGSQGSFVVIGDEALSPATSLTDGGSQAASAAGTWQRLAPLPVDAGRVVSLTMDPSDADLLFAATDSSAVTAVFRQVVKTYSGHVFVSSDGGVSWIAAKDFSAEGLAVHQLLLDPASPSVLYAIVNGVTGFRAMRSVDGGATWGRLPGLVGCSGLWLGGGPASTLYVADGAGELLRSTDRGDTWTPLGLEPGPVWSFAVDPDDPSVMYVSGKDRVLRSDDEGMTWKDAAGLPVGPRDASTSAVWYLVAGPLGESAVYALSCKVEPDGLVPPLDEAATADLVGASDHGFVTADQGSTWSELDETQLVDLKVRLRVVPGTDPDTLEKSSASVLQTLERDESGKAASLTDGDTGATVSVSTAVAIDPDYPEWISVGTSDGLYRSLDGGASWRKVPVGVDATDAATVIVDPTSTSVLYAASDEALFKSTDDGATWTRILEAGGTLLIAPSNHLNLFYAIEGPAGEALLRSSDGGATWTPVSVPAAGRPLRLLAIDPTNPATVYASYSISGATQLSKSVDGGTTWETIGSDLPANGELVGMVIDPGQPYVLYAGLKGGEGSGGVYKSTDGGTRWTPLRSGLWRPAGVESLALGAGAQPSLFAVLATAAPEATGHGLVARSTDAGETWQEWLNEPGWNISRLVADPAGSAALYIWNEPISYTADTGLWALQDEGTPRDLWLHVDTSGDGLSTLPPWARSAALVLDGLKWVPVPDL